MHGLSGQTTVFDLSEVMYGDITAEAVGLKQQSQDM